MKFNEQWRRADSEENENDYEDENEAEDGLLVLAATVRRGRRSATRR